MVENILTKSRAKNPAVGITGSLLPHDLFLQILEDLTQRHKLYETILADNRHAEIVKLRDETFTVDYFHHGQ